MPLSLSPVPVVNTHLSGNTADALWCGQCTGCIPSIPCLISASKDDGQLTHWKKKAWTCGYSKQEVFWYLKSSFFFSYLTKAPLLLSFSVKFESCMKCQPNPSTLKAQRCQDPDSVLFSPPPTIIPKSWHHSSLQVERSPLAQRQTSSLQSLSAKGSRLRAWLHIQSEQRELKWQQPTQGQAADLRSQRTSASFTSSFTFSLHNWRNKGNSMEIY